MVIGNPAHRLHTLLVEAMKHPPDNVARLAWAPVFEVEHTDTPGIYRGLAELEDLVTETERLIKLEAGDDADMLLEGFPNIRVALNPQDLNAQWRQSASYLNPRVLRDLEWCARKLKHYTEDPLSPDTLQMLLQQIDDLGGFVLSAEIGESLRRTLMDLLEPIRTAVIQYKIRGAEGMRRAVDRAVGGLIRAWSEETNERNSGVWLRIVEGIEVVNRFATAAGKLQPTFEVVKNVLALTAGKSGPPSA